MLTILKSKIIIKRNLLILKKIFQSFEKIYGIISQRKLWAEKDGKFSSHFVGL